MRHSLEVNTIMLDSNETRRRFMAHFATLGLSTTLLPGVLWAGMQQAGAQKVNSEMLKESLAIAGLEFADDERERMLDTVNRALSQYETLHKFHIPNDIQPPFYFNPLVPGMK